MRSSTPQLPSLTRPLLTLGALIALAAPAAAAAAPTKPPKARAPVNTVGVLAQLHKSNGCLVDRSSPRRGCKPVRALAGPAPLLGSDAVAISGDGKNVYVAASTADAIAIFKRDTRTGRLSQASGAAGCVAAKRANGCGKAIGLDGPNSVAVSANGKNVYATSLGSEAVTTFRRNPSTGALTQRGCISNVAVPGCTTGRALKGPDVVKVSPDGKNVYVGAFLGSAIAVFTRNTSTGALTQPSDVTGCIVDAPTAGCTTGLALGSPEGLAISGDGDNVYVAAPASNAVGIYTRDASTGALTQATDGTGCIVNAALAGCTIGVQLAGADAVAISPDDDNVYVTSLLSNSLTTFNRTAGTGQLTQASGTSACAIYLLAVGCSLARAFSGPEGVAVSPDGASVYATAFTTGALGVFDRTTSSGALMQKTRRPGCVTSTAIPDCTPGRALAGASSIVVSPDGRHVYAAAFKSNAVSVFKRVTAPKGR